MSRQTCFSCSWTEFIRMTLLVTRCIAPDCGVTLKTIQFLPSVDILRESFSNPSATLKKTNFPIALETKRTSDWGKSQHCVSRSNGRGKPRIIARRSYSNLLCMAKIKHASLNYRVSRATCRVHDGWIKLW